jgi:hypothetical protein
MADGAPVEESGFEMFDVRFEIGTVVDETGNSNPISNLSGDNNRGLIEHRTSPGGRHQ